jgi:hypothetical protein
LADVSPFFAKVRRLPFELLPVVQPVPVPVRSKSQPLKQLESREAAGQHDDRGEEQLQAHSNLDGEGLRKLKKLASCFSFLNHSSVPFLQQTGCTPSLGSRSKNHTRNATTAVIALR